MFILADIEPLLSLTFTIIYIPALLVKSFSHFLRQLCTQSAAISFLLLFIAAICLPEVLFYAIITYLFCEVKL